MDYFISVAMFTLITIVSVSGVYMLTGLTGMFSLGQAAFMAISCYVSAFLVVKAGLPFWLATILSILFTVLVGFIIGLPTVRLRRDYISLATLGFGLAVTSMLNQMVSITGGANGFSGIPQNTSFPLALISAIVCIALAACFKKSKYGRQCIALKSDELAAKAMGINVTRIKMIAFLISVAITAYAGVLYAFYTTYVEPESFDWKQSGQWVIMVFFGGVNSLTGSIVSAAFLTVLPEVLRFSSDFNMVLYSVLVLLVINFKPSGIFGEYELSPSNIKRLFVRKRKGEKRNAA